MIDHNIEKEIFYIEETLPALIEKAQEMTDLAIGDASPEEVILSTKAASRLYNLHSRLDTRLDALRNQLRHIMERDA